MTFSKQPAAVFLVLLAAVPAQVVAQRLSFAPQIGFYFPTQNLYEAAGGDEFKLEGGPSFGARLGVWFGSRFGIEASGAYVPTSFKLESGGQEITSENAKLFTGSGQAVLFILPRTSLLTLYLNGGVGVVSRGGVAFTDDAKTSDLTGVFGGGAGLNLGGLALTLGAELFTYTATVDTEAQVAQSSSQRDIQLKLGFGIPFGGRGQPQPAFKLHPTR